MWGERIEEGGPVMERALRGPEVSIGVWEMTVAVLRGPSPFSLTYARGLTQTERGVEVGTRGCRQVHRPSPGDHQRPAACLPACLPVCLNADLCHPLQTRDCFFNKIPTQTGAHANRHRQNTHIQKYTSIKTC